MPGQVLDIKAKEGDSIKKGDTVLVLSAMKVWLLLPEGKRTLIIRYLDGNRGEEYDGRKSKENTC